MQFTLTGPIIPYVHRNKISSQLEEIIKTLKKLRRTTKELKKLINKDSK